MEESCHYYLPKKRRYCRLQQMKGQEYCVQHIETSTTSSSPQCDDANQRIRCPLDPSHTCDKRRLQKHLKNCNVTKLIPTDPWYVAEINAGEVESNVDTVKMLREVPPQEIKDLISKIRDVSRLLPPLGKNDDSHPSLNGEISEFENCESATKKLVQNSSLLAILASNGILQSPCNYIEFGAGRGQFTTSIIKALPVDEVSDCSFVLVDRGTNRRKLDSKYRQIGQSQITRLRTDIKDLCLRKLEVLENRVPVVGVSKHLCGCATDLTLRCVTNAMPDINFAGSVIALCCHHRCNWSDYVGKDLFAKFELTPRDFSIISLMSSWAVCCFRDTVNDVDEENKGPLHFISDAEKEEVGCLCKRIVDCGRVEYLTKLGFNANLIEYTDKSITLENIALVFSQKASK